MMKLSRTNDRFRELGGGGLPEGGNPGFPYPDEAAEINIDQLKPYPCAYALAQELPNLNNELADALKKIFKTSDKFDITFKAKTGMPPSKDGETSAPPRKDLDRFFATISLNSDMLQNATKEYILVTMYHEVIHAYLSYELTRLGQTGFENAYPKLGFVYDKNANGDITRIYVTEKDHLEFGQFIDTLENIITSYNSANSPNSKMSPETARAMAKYGITALTVDEKKLNDREQGLNQTLGQQQGTKCTP
ncbi:hypothetical protein [Elizabethkingia anophelis]|uniref:hypothetical protein n=1 Tax=Elizabethkingia anophelis TaxID=1117645 RepID=UPI00301D8F7D